MNQVVVALPAPDAENTASGEPVGVGVENGASSQLLSLHAENAAPVPRGRPFEPGKSGNPNGRPKGARNRTTVAAEALIEGKAEELVNKAVELALAGDATLLRAFLNTVAPPRRDRTVEFELPKITTA